MKMSENLRLSKLYSYSCFRSQFRNDHSRIGERGFSRVVHCNDLDDSEPTLLNYKDNYISTTKYTVANFFPKSLFEQFRRVANFYFLVVVLVSYTPMAPYKAVSLIAPLTLVIAATMAKEGVEDWKRRKQDVEVNNRKISVLGENDQFEESKWKRLRVGDIVRVFKDEYFPSDLLIISSSYDDGICYVETMNLDGETNLKVKHSLSATSWLQDEDSLKDFKAVIKCEDPNDNLYSFVGTLHHGSHAYPLSMQQLLLRDSKLKNTEYVTGLVIFTGHDTKVMQNAVEAPSKRSNIERRMDKIIYLLFIILIAMVSTGSVFFAINTKRDLQQGNMRKWYLRPDQTKLYFNPKRASIVGAAHFLTGLMLYNYLIPISLYISIEVVKVLQSIFINQDRSMYYEETDRPARARTSNLNEELGQVDTILSDKTGTLTCNSMDFVKCSIGGVPYGEKSTDRKPIKGFNFYDERILYRNWVKESHSSVIQSFFRVFALCNMAVPAVDRVSGHCFYEAESPDEVALVIAAREVGFELIERSQTTITLSELDQLSGQKVKRVYEILQVLDFTSSRKRMSVIVRSEENRILLLSKGADSVMFERLCEDDRRFERNTKEHIKLYSEAGLRTLVIAFREVEEDAYRAWEDEFMEAKTTVNADREAVIDAIADKMERELVLLGSSAVEDKLQTGVSECIRKLSEAGIKIWLLTGDKMETAVNIGYACNLLRPEMTRIYINLDSLEISAVEREIDKKSIVEVSFESVMKQITEGVSIIDKSQGNGEEFSLVVDGKSLAFALDHTLENKFMALALRCASVICCRSTPKHKALVTRLVKNSIRKTTLAIGDGANDVGMLQEADIGVGISGVEGMQAVMASDYAIAQFRFLERLLLVHGHWCYKRIAMMICYFFYKNLAFGFTLFFFEAYTGFSGQPAYNDWYLSCYNVLFTSLPVIALGVFDQDVSARFCLRYPLLYQEGVQNVMFTWRRIIGWMCNGVLTSSIIFFTATSVMGHQAFRSDGRVADYSAMGVTLYSCVVWSVNCQMAISISYFTWIQHFVIWGSILMWYIFLMVYGVVPPTLSTSAFKAFVETCAPSPRYWITLLVVVVASEIPLLVYRILKTHFRPTYLNLIQAARLRGELLPLPSH